MNIEKFIQYHYKIDKKFGDSLTMHLSLHHRN